MDLFNELAQEAHDACTGEHGFVPRDVAMNFVDRVKAQRGSGSAEVSAFLDRLLIAGASKWLANWRRRTFTPALTRKGAMVDLPEYAGVIDAEGEHRQLHLLDLGLADLEQHIDKLERSRNTYSKALAVLRDMADAMRADPRLRKARDAFEKLGRAA